MRPWKNQNCIIFGLNTMGTQINHYMNTVRLFFCIFGETQSTSSAKVQGKKPRNITNCILTVEGTALFSDSVPCIINNRTYFTKSCVKVIFLFESLCFYKITDWKKSECIFNKLGGKVQTL